MAFSQIRIRLLLLLCLLAGFGAQAFAGRLTIYPNRVELTGTDREHGLVVLVSRDDGRTIDVTRRCEFASRAPGIVSVDRNGACRVQGDGDGEVEVKFEGESATVPVTARDTAQKVVPSFRQDVLPILTRSGCNAGGCHGKLVGQNGFRLSLRGFAPDWDHDWITKEVNGRRVDYAFPEKSLLVEKASGSVTHEGGQRFREGSRPWQTLVDWIAARAPAPPEAEADATSLELLPGDREMQPGDSQQLLARAHYADGRVRDVTWLAQFFSNDEATVSVKPGGLAKAKRAGEGSVRVHFQGLVQVVRFTMPHDNDVSAADFASQQNALDVPIFAKLRGLRLPPSPACDDTTFIRRAFLDTIATLPTPEEVTAFLADTRPDKRARLVDDLLVRPEWVDFWTLQLADLLQNRKERDHDVRGAKGVRSFHAWLHDQLAANRPWSEIAKSVLLARGDSVANPEVGYFVTVVGEKRNVEESELPDSVAQSFLGTRIGCARCHNHPLEKYTQDDFYHFAAFFAKVSMKRVEPAKGATQMNATPPDEEAAARRLEEERAKLEEAEGVALRIGEEPGGEEARKSVAERKRAVEESAKKLAEQRAKMPGVNQPRTNQRMAPQSLDRQPFTFEPGSDPRDAFVKWMLDPQNEYFAGAMVNRLWKHFLGTGLVEPVDDLRASNPPSNSELWKLLKTEFASHGTDLKHVMRLILNSRAYQLSSDTLAGNETDTRFYSHYYARRLPAEVLLDAIAGATKAPAKFDGYPLGIRAVQLPDASVQSYFLSLFGRSDRVTACACERKGEVTLPQLLHLKNGDELQRQIATPQGRLAELLKTPDDRMALDALFFATVNRPPRESEINAVSSAIAADQRDAVFRDLFWALLNSKEFAFNH
jgi:hypothetical protein